MTLDGSTLGIDPTAIVHVAGISADGGATFDGIVYANRFMGYGNSNTGILLDGGLNNFYVNTSGQSRMKVESGGVIAYVKLQADELFHAKQGISMDAAGITFPDGTFQSSAASGSGVTAGAGMVLTGSTLGIDPTAAIHVAGVSSDGGITAGGRVFAEEIGIDNGQGGGTHLIVKDWAQLQLRPGGTLVTAIDGNGNFTFGRNYATTYIQSGSYVHAGTGVSLDAGGITFPDGTFQSTAASASSGGSEFVSSHNILLELPDNKEYYLDGYTVTDRTYNLLYGKSATGGCTADLVAGGVTLASIGVTPTGASGSFSTAVVAGTEVSVVITGVTTGVFLEDVRLVAGYTQ